MRAFKNNIEAAEWFAAASSRQHVAIRAVSVIVGRDRMTLALADFYESHGRLAMADESSKPSEPRGGARRPSHANLL